MIFTILLIIIGMSIATATYADTPVIGVVHKQRTDIRDRDYSAAEEDIWDVEELVITNVNIVNDSNITAYSPRIRITGSSHVERGSTFRAGVPVFKVHFVNMVDPGSAVAPSDVYPGVGIDFTEEPFIGQPGPSMTQDEFEEFCLNEIEILNYYFKSDDGRQLVKFVMKDARLWDPDIVNTNYYLCTSSGVTIDDCPPAYGDGKKALDAFNDDDFADFRDNNTINIVFFDCPDKLVSGGDPNLVDNGPPIILLDYQRVDENLGHDCPSGTNDDCGIDPWGNVLPGSSNNGIQDDDHDRFGVEPHEMGHVFGLYHVCRDHPYPSPGVDLWDNIMWSSFLLMTPTGYDECCEHIEANCQNWYRTSFFSKEPISRVDGDYKYIQSYMRGLDYEDGFEKYGQAEIIMNMAHHFKGYLE